MYPIYYFYTIETDSRMCFKNAHGTSILERRPRRQPIGVHKKASLGS